MVFKKICFAWLAIISVVTTQAQELMNYSLKDLSSFKSQAGNWAIVGDVMMDPSKNVNSDGNTGITVKEGTGVLINRNDDKIKSHLVSSWEHGDMEIEFEFMMPKGSNSGFYLQGRYEVQLFDSWGVKYPKYSDLGGIYRNWESSPGKIYMGKEPMINAAKAPGLWQKMYISFNAPRFDHMGKKIQNAKLNLVKVNGAIIHENIEIPLPTGGPLENNEVAKGPVMIQGDHGAVAFRNIKYRLLENDPIKVGPVSYKYWKGPYVYESDYKSKKADKEGISKEGITWEMTDVQDFFAIHLTSEIDVPYTDNYYFEPVYNGRLAVYIDNKEVFKNTGAWSWDRIRQMPFNLEKGKHKIDVYYSRADAWLPPALALNLGSDRLAPQPLHAPSSFFVKSFTAPILVDVKGEPVILRAFLDFKQERLLRRTHTVGVGDPTGMHYVFDNALGTLSCIWRGKFVDATPMWQDRGDGSFRPLGDAVYLDNTPQLDILSSPSSGFASKFSEEEFRSKGYSINEFTKTPIFKYTLKGMEVEDQTYADAVSNSLVRTVKITNSKEGTYFRLAHGNSIEKVSETTYLVDGNYYITTLGSYSLREADGRKELITLVPQSGIISYFLSW
jgi:hypothetical protein